jgi:hypothetical protein
LQAVDSDARRDPEAALSRDLDICSKAWSDLKRDPADASARQLYNYSVARIVSLLQATGKLERAGTIGTGANAYKLTFASDLKPSLIRETAILFRPTNWRFPEKTFSNGFAGMESARLFLPSLILLWKTLGSGC